MNPENSLDTRPGETGSSLPRAAAALNSRRVDRQGSSRLENAGRGVSKDEALIYARTGQIGGRRARRSRLAGRDPRAQIRLRFFRWIGASTPPPRVRSRDSERAGAACADTTARGFI